MGGHYRSTLSCFLSCDITLLLLELHRLFRSELPYESVSMQHEIAAVQPTAIEQTAGLANPTQLPSRHACAARCCAAAIPAFNLRQHPVNIPRGIVVLHRGTNNCDLFADIAAGFLATCHIQRLANPFGDRHMSRTSHALNLAIIRIAQQHLKPLSHVLSVLDSWL